MKYIKVILNTKRTLPFLFVISLFCFYILNHFTDLAIDDFSYKFIFSDDPFKTNCRVATFSDLLESQYNHYFITNGRVLVNGLAQVFLMTENKIWFNIANTMMFGFLQILIFLIVGLKIKDFQVLLYVFSLTLFWFLIPGPNHSLLSLGCCFRTGIYLFAS
jgi:hypothetical protein